MHSYLTIQRFFDVPFDHGFFHLLVSNALVFDHPFSIGCFVYKSVLDFHVFYSFLPLKLLIVLIDALVLREVLLILTSILIEVVLVLQVSDVSFKLFVLAFLFSLEFLFQLLVKSVEHCFFYVLGFYLILLF
jgi:hypothetical protein